MEIVHGFPATGGKQHSVFKENFQVNEGKNYEISSQSPIVNPIYIYIHKVAI